MMIKVGVRTRSVTNFLSVLRRNESTSQTPPDIKAMIRVNLAGETGADKIYAGQMAVLGK